MRSAILFAGLGVLIPAAAWSNVVLPPVQYQSFLGLNPGSDTTYTTVGAFGVTEIDCRPTTPCVSATLLPGKASLFANGFANETSTVQGRVNYYFEIVGPQVNSISLDFSFDNTYDYTGVADATNWAVSAGINVQTNASPIGDVAFCGSIQFPNCTPEQVAGTISSRFFSSNTPYFIGLTVIGEVTEGSNGDAFLSATADPTISFAPGFDSTGYQIVVSPGIQNGPNAVPEPATGLLGGLGFLGALALRRRRVS